LFETIEKKSQSLLNRSLIPTEMNSELARKLLMSQSLLNRSLIPTLPLFLILFSVICKALF
ncbi:MAG: hypothetical protein LDL13_08985, partial [Calditerrivibrio sp.]|nr:hypothetical protein [Calditerrivibrio sp.]